jgi:fatty acid CoA ligase FadD32
VRSAVTSVHGVQPTEVRIVEQGSIPRSSANKIARRVASKLWIEGVFA